MNNTFKQHWDNIYKKFRSGEVSWTENKPETSLEFINSFHLPKNAAIIDIGGGDGKLVDFLIDEGYSDITVLDITNEALERAKKRLGDKAKKVTWIVCDVKTFRPTRKYDLWHDRATFHFLTTEKEVKDYITIIRNCVTQYMVVGTFSDTGPTKCSGLTVKQYSDEQLAHTFMDYFKKIMCINVDHVTPFHTKQNFTFCSFMKIAA